MLPAGVHFIYYYPHISHVSPLSPGLLLGAVTGVMLALSQCLEGRVAACSCTLDILSTHLPCVPSLPRVAAGGGDRSGAGTLPGRTQKLYLHTHPDDPPVQTPVFAVRHTLTILLVVDPPPPPPPPPFQIPLSWARSYINSDCEHLAAICKHFKSHVKTLTATCEHFNSNM